MSDFFSYETDLANTGGRMQRLKSKRLNKKKLFFRLIMILFIIFLGLYSGYCYGGAVKKIINEKISATFADEETSEKGSRAVAGKVDSPEKNILIMGTDERKNEPSRSDTIIVLMLNSDTKKACFISLPRDSRVKIEGLKHKTKLNHAHATGGVDLARKTVENLLGIKINNYMETNFTGFENIIDLTGGIELDVERRMYYPQEDINIKKGMRKLDGHDALGYVRYRSDGKGDLGRIERQQKFIKELIAQNLKIGTLVKLPKIIEELKNNVKSDLSVTDYLLLANDFKSMDTENVVFYQLPGKPEYLGGASYYIVDEEKLSNLMAEIKKNLDSETILNKDTNQSDASVQ